MQFWNNRDRQPDPVVTTADGTPVAAPPPGPTEADVKAAYEKGRRDERASRQNHPILTVLVVLAAIVGVVAIFLSVREGSFSGAGAAADKIANSRSAPTEPRLTAEAPPPNPADVAAASVESAAAGAVPQAQAAAAVPPPTIDTGATVQP